MVVRTLLAWLERLRARTPAPPLVLYTKRDCPLCDEMKTVLRRARLRPSPPLSEVDVERDPELLARYGRSIPVLTIGGRVAFKGRASVPELERKYARFRREGTAEASRGRARGGQSGHG